MQISSNFIVESYLPGGNERHANASVGITVWTFAEKKFPLVTENKIYISEPVI
jgi:hypothetical protein